VLLGLDLAGLSAGESTVTVTVEIPLRYEDASGIRAQLRILSPWPTVTRR